MAAAVLSCCSVLTSRLNNLSLTATSSSPSQSSSISFSSSVSHNPSLFSTGCLSMRPVEWSVRRSSVVCEAAPGRKADSAVKRARQAEKRRVHNKAKKSEVRTRMRKLLQVLEALDDLRKKPAAQPEEVLPVEKLIAETYSVIDKAVKVGTLHRNTGARRKSRLARTKKAVEVHHGWYTPASASPAAADAV
ncbi:unnamed protein product [Linum tenue]|uniref:Small ribosomal subunit protein bS20c n=1 Tax=Linum tenue TaxID=586396 RepID=A0AAV0M525_9ROSI|nr:unnamed protein product [Linum tenue]